MLKLKDGAWKSRHLQMILVEAQNSGAQNSNSCCPPPMINACPR